MAKILFFLLVIYCAWRLLRAAFPKRISREIGRVFDPYEALELPPGASTDQIETQYKRLLSQYHPDKVEHLGKELRRLAHEKTIQIQRAYQMIRGE